MLKINAAAAQRECGRGRASKGSIMEARSIRQFSFTSSWRSHLKTRTTPKLAASALAAVFVLAAGQAQANKVWHWSYTGSGISAGGLLQTSDTADADGFYQMLSISGSRNGDAITGLFPTGSAIPGNEPFAVDNLIRLGAPDQLTVHGLGYSLASGAHSNPFYADFLTPATYLEVFTHGSSFSEVPITFTAAAVPEPATLALAVSGLLVVGWAQRAKKRAA
jgi:hypothetical protein